MKQQSHGFGTSIPPEKLHVVIYFMQKDRNEKEALDFFNFYTIKNWRNQKGELIKDWKMHAWEWIWNKVK